MTNKIYDARICLFPEGHGGRQNSFTSNEAKLGIKFSSNNEDTQFSAIIRQKKNKIIALGNISKAKLQFINDTDVSKFITKGACFEIFEGARRIGVGKWI